MLEKALPYIITSTQIEPLLYYTPTQSKKEYGQQLQATGRQKWTKKKRKKR